MKHFYWYKMIFAFAVGCAVFSLVFALLNTVTVSAPSETYASPFEIQPFQITGGIVPHHALADGVIAQFFDEIATENPRRIILLSPDHFGMSRALFTTT